MSDIPGLLAIVLSLYLCLRAIACESPRTAAQWLMGACVASAFLGTARQTGWLGLLVVVPSACWLLRGRRLPWVLLAVVWMAGVLFVGGCLAWFNHQLYAIVEGNPAERMDRVHVIGILVAVVRAALDVAFLLLPILVIFWKEIPPKSRRILLLVLMLPAAFLFLRLHSWSVGFLLTPTTDIGNYVTANGLLVLPDIGRRALVIPMAVRAAITLLCLYSAGTFLAFLAQSRRSSAPRADDGQLSWSELLVLTGPLALAYCMFLALRIVGATMFDRYTLPLLLLLALAAVRLYQDRVRRNIPAAGFAMLAFVALFAIAGTHDLFAVDRARARAIDELRASGLSRSQFYGGFGYDGWTQIDNQGYIYVAGTRTASGKLIANAQAAPFEPCGYSVAQFFPSLHPRYAVSYDDVTCAPQQIFSPVAYRLWLPPFSGHLYIRAIDAATAGRIGH